MSCAYGADGRYERDAKNRIAKEKLTKKKLTNEKLTPQQLQTRESIFAGMTKMMVGKAEMIDAKINKTNKNG